MNIYGLLSEVFSDFEKGNSWLQHPDMSTGIMLEERRGLFVLPSSKLSGAVTVPADEGQRVVGLCGHLPRLWLDLVD